MPNISPNTTTRRRFGQVTIGLVGLWASMSFFATPALAADEAPDAMIKRLSAEILDVIRSDPSVHSGDFDRVIAVVDSMLLPNLDFRRITASAVGPGWRQATPQQQARLQSEFKTLLVRTYALSLRQVDNQQVVVKPMRLSADEREVIVRTEVRGRAKPVQVDYRLEKTPGEGAGWKIYDVNVVGIWLVDTYRSQFAPEVNARGIDELIATLAARNGANAGKE
ncbi:ABC transporter substrate-binding protein [soil metagenome]